MWVHVVAADPSPEKYPNVLGWMTGLVTSKKCKPWYFTRVAEAPSVKYCIETEAEGGGFYSKDLILLRVIRLNYTPLKIKEVFFQIGILTKTVLHWA